LTQKRKLNFPKTSQLRDRISIILYIIKNNNLILSLTF